MYTGGPNSKGNFCNILLYQKLFAGECRIRLARKGPSVCSAYIVDVRSTTLAKIKIVDVLRKKVCGNNILYALEGDILRKHLKW